MRISERRLRTRLLLSSDRLDLAPLGASDLGPFLRATRDSVGLHRPWVRPPTDANGFREFAASALGEQRARLLLWSREHLARGDRDDALCGYFSLGEIVRGDFESAYMGYWVTAAYAGQGVMSEGIELVLEAAFSRLHLHRVEANIQPGNEASLALARSTGFRHEGFSPGYLRIEGQWRDHERWAMTIEDWKARSQPSPPARAPLTRATLF